MSRLFEILGAPLRNKRWSWGAEREDGTIVLRQWSDDLLPHNGEEFFQVLRTTGPASRPLNPGLAERLRHVKRIQSGAPCYIVVVEPEYIDANTKRVRRCDTATIVVTKDIQEVGGYLCVRVIDRVPAESLVPKPRRS